jgi:serine/threonine protein kinase
MEGQDIQPPEGDTSPRPGSPGVPRVAYSSLDRLFSQSGVFDSIARDSHQYGTLSVIDRFAAFSDPITVLGNLMVTLKEHNIPGPRLLRMKNEFTIPLGQGAQSEVFAFDESILSEVGLNPKNLPGPIEDLTKVAVKRSRVTRPRSRRFQSSPTTISSEEFVFQCSAAHQEIDILCQNSFRKHPNIVRLLSWGLCLDTLEEDDEESPRLPLLILERAACNLSEFLTHPAAYTSKNTFNNLHGICLDVGRGLDAIHKASIAHGDLKPENILIFQNSGKWVAKLCDFGLSASESGSSSGSIEYRGTPGWRPPEYYRQDRNPLNVRGIQLCDIFSFGLIVWSVFRHGGQPPLSPTHEMNGNAFGLATQELTKLGIIPKHEHRRVILTVQGALLEDANARLRHPWKYLDKENYQHVGARVRLRRELAKKTRNFRHAIRDYLNPERDEYANGSSSKLRRERTCLCCLPGWQQLEDDDPAPEPQLVASPERHQAYLDAFETYCKPFGLANPGSIDMFQHRVRACFSEPRLRILHDNLAAAIQRRDEVQTYALARLRSRFPLCCWAKIRKGRLTNMISQYVQDTHDFVVLAWLCRGDIGASELHDEKHMESIFRLVCAKPRSFGYRFIRNDHLTIQQRVARFLLLLEHGARIETVLNSEGETVFLRFLRLSAEFSKNGYGDLSVKDICISFKRLVGSKHILPSTRFYMTGELPELAEDTTGCTNTALHDAVLAENYSVVESLVRSGFFINALNRDNRPALYVALHRQQQQLQPSSSLSSAMSKVQKTQRRTDNNSLYRIIALLQQNTASNIDINLLPLKSSGIPLGWEKQELNSLRRSEESENPVPSFFYDVLSASSTFKQPRFSLYEDRRLALGARRFSASGQSYYLDLLRFISPSSVEEDTQDLFADIDVFDDEWFKNEPWTLVPPGSADGQTPPLPLTTQDLAAVRSRRHKSRSISMGRGILGLSYKWPGG